MITTIGLILAVALAPVGGTAGAEQTADKPAEQGRVRCGKVIGVMGSSVAYGYLSSYKRPDDFRNGYAHRLARLLQPRGWVTLTKLSMPGDTTERVLERIGEDLFPIADYAIIGLSLENEGIRMGESEKVFKQFAKNLKKIVRQCRQNDVVPVVGLCYANNNFQPEDYQYVKDMNLLINTWDVASINFLGAADDGAGHWANGYYVDRDHPNNDGYEEMFYAIVPSLFDALKAGKPKPRRAKGAAFVTVKSDAGPTPLSFTPEDTMHSFAVAFRVRASVAGTIAVVEAGKASAAMVIQDGGLPAYVSSTGETVVSPKKVGTKKWHDVVLSHRHALGQTAFFVDGEPVGAVSEKLVPECFILGGPGAVVKTPAPPQADYREWMIYRAALNEDEVQAIHRKKLLQASLEVYAPLAEGTLEANTPVENRAQSMSQVVAYPAPPAGA